MTIIEVQTRKMEYLKEHAAKLIKHSKKLLACLEELEEISEESEMYHPKKRKMKDEDCEEYSRYY